MGKEESGNGDLENGKLINGESGPSVQAQVPCTLFTVDFPTVDVSRINKQELAMIVMAVSEDFC